MPSPSLSRPATARAPKQPWRGGRLSASAMDARIDRLLDVAAEEFAASGFGGTSLDRIVERSGVSKTTIFRRFGNKEGLFHTLVKHTLVTIRASMAAVETAMDPDDPPRAIEHFVTAYVDNAIRTPLGHALLAIAVLEKQTFPTLGATIMATAIEGLQPITRYIAYLIDHAIIAPCDPVEAALDLQALMNQGVRVMVDDTAFLNRPGRAGGIARRFLQGWA